MDAMHASPRVDGAKMRRQRQRMRLTATQLAERLGLSASYVAAIERGQRPTVAPATYGRITDALGLDYDDLLKTKPTTAAA